MNAFDAALAWVRAHADLGIAIAAADRAGHDPLSAAAAIPFVRTEVLRPAALRAWRDRVQSTGRALAEGAAADLAILGTGPTGAALARMLSRARPDLAIVVVDRDLPGGPFARAGAGFRLNTWGAPGPGGMSLLDEVDLHAGLAVSPSLMSGARFPPADTLGDAALLTCVGIDCGAVLGEVTAISIGEHVELALPRHGGPLRARAAVLAAGFGSEPVRSFDAAGSALLRDETRRPFEQRRAVDAEALFAQARTSGLGSLDGA